MLSSDAWGLIEELTKNDPFNLKELIKNDIPRWGSWPVSDRAKSYYYRIREFLKTEFFKYEKELIHEAETRPPETRWKPLKKLHEIKLKAK
jgi:acyl-CoA dehydrogenase family protein 10